EAATQMRTSSQHDGRYVGAHRAHQLRWRGLVAVAQQYHAIQWMSANHFLGVHRHQVAIEHRRGSHEELAKRNSWEFQRSTTGLPDATLHVVRELAEVVVAVVQIALRLRDADDRSGEVRI